MSMRVSKFGRYFLALTCLFLVHCQYTDLRAIMLNNKTVEKLKEQSLDESQAKYLKALELEPLLPEVQGNLGVTYDALKDPERALKMYKNAEEYSTAEIQSFPERVLISNLEKRSKTVSLFAALFNQGQLLARENKTDEALKKYQEALSISPGSQEIKTNIELMFQKQQGKGQGEGKSDDKNQDQNGKDPKGDSKDDKENKDDKEGKQPKNYSGSPKYKPRDFKGELTKENVQKIFGEISQQEKKMRSQFSKQNQTKEAPREKDW